MDEIDYFLHGDDMQFVEIELDPGEAAIGEAGSMMYMEDGIQMDTIFGDGSGQQNGIFGALLGAGKRLITGESLFTTVYTNTGSDEHRRGGARASPEGVYQPDGVMPDSARTGRIDGALGT